MCASEMTEGVSGVNPSKNLSWHGLHRYCGLPCSSWESVMGFPHLLQLKLLMRATLRYTALRIPRARRHLRCVFTQYFTRIPSTVKVRLPFTRLRFLVVVLMLCRKCLRSAKVIHHVLQILRPNDVAVFANPLRKIFRKDGLKLPVMGTAVIHNASRAPHVVVSFLAIAATTQVGDVGLRFMASPSARRLDRLVRLLQHQTYSLVHTNCCYSRDKPVDIQYPMSYGGRTHLTPTHTLRRCGRGSQRVAL